MAWPRCADRRWLALLFAHEKKRDNLPLFI
jgi:hypothetical protein